MKKKKRKLIKEAGKKAAISTIKDALIAELTAVTFELGQDSKKLKKEIEKRSAQLAKKIAKKVKIKTAKPEAVAEETPAAVS